MIAAPPTLAPAGAQRRALRAALLIGIGLGGFVDGIVLHQMLQWHQMLSARLPPLSVMSKNINMFYDVVFHAGCWLVTLWGVVALWRALPAAGPARLPLRLLWGGLLMGWALFNVAEGLVGHHLLHLHNVREITPHVAAYNWGFLLLSVGIGALGWLLARRARQAAP